MAGPLRKRNFFPTAIKLEGGGGGKAIKKKNFCWRLPLTDMNGIVGIPSLLWRQLNNVLEQTAKNAFYQE